jgi:hypothetical protein
VEWTIMPSLFFFFFFVISVRRIWHTWKTYQSIWINTKRCRNSHRWSQTSSDTGTFVFFLHDNFEIM